MLRTLNKPMLALLIIPLLSACGSDNEQAVSDEGVIDPIQEVFTGTGQLLIAGQSISGMSYETPTTSGVTDETGQFSYEEGESIQFTLAGLPFGSVLGSPTLEVSDFESEAVPTSYADFERYRQQTVLLNSDIRGINTSYKSYANPQALDRLANRLFLLTALDNDNQIDNGIQLDIGEQTSAIFAQVALPINLNTTEFVGRMKSRAILLNYNEAVNGFSALVKYLTALQINIAYPESMCMGSASSGSVPSSWSVNYKNDQQQTILLDNFNTCAALPNVDQAAEYVQLYSADSTLRYVYHYDEQGRLTHEYRDTDGTANLYDRLYLHEYSSDDGNALEAVSFFYDDGESHVVSNKTTYTYSQAGLLLSKWVDDDTDDLTVYGYSDEGIAQTETIYSESQELCYGGDLETVTQTNYLYYYENGQLRQRSNEGMCATNTYDYSYNDLGQALTRFHNVDAATDTNPETISYEYELFAQFTSGGDMSFYSSVSRNYDGSLTSNQYDYTYNYDDASRLISSIRTSIKHNNVPATSSASPVTYSYTENGHIENVCYGETCDYELTYGYTNEGLIDWVAVSYGGTLSSKSYYQYNEKNLVVKSSSFYAASVDDELNPIDADVPDYVTIVEYLPSGAIATINRDGNIQYFSDPQLDNSNDENGYYQWFTLDLAEHLNREVTSPRSFAGGGDT